MTLIDCLGEWVLNHNSQEKLPIGGRYSYNVYGIFILGGIYKLEQDIYTMNVVTVPETKVDQSI